MAQYPALILLATNACKAVGTWRLPELAQGKPDGASGPGQLGVAPSVQHAKLRRLLESHPDVDQLAVAWQLNRVDYLV
jgi:hypothetical protein